MHPLDELKRDLIRGNSILANEDIVDAWGYISVRNSDNLNTYFLPRSRSPGLVDMDNILVSTWTIPRSLAPRRPSMWNGPPTA